MDTAADLSEPTSYKAQNNHSGNYLDSLKSETDNSDLHDTLLPFAQDKSEISFGSYISSPVKSAIHWTYNVADFAAKHPTQMIITSLLMAAQLTVIAADCNCIWRCYESYGLGDSSYRVRTLGQFSNETACKEMMSVSANNCYYEACL
jgi:hypothetical protein